MNDLLLRFALAWCPREFRESYRARITREFAAQGSGIGAAWDIARSGIAERLDTVGRDTVVAARGLVRAPLFTAISLTTLAIAIGVNTVVFGVINAVLLQPLPFVQADRLAMLCASSSGSCGAQLTNATLREIRQRTSTLDAIAAYQYSSATLTGTGRARALQIAWTTANYFEVVGIRPELGRFFERADTRAGKHVAVLSYELWQRQFSGAPDVIGKTIRLDGEGWTVIGVAPRFVMPSPGSNLQSNFASLWEPRAGESLLYHNWVLARVKPGVSMQAAGADLGRIASALAARDPIEYKGLTLGALGLQDWYFRIVRPLLLVASAAVFAVLLIACANVTNLLLVRATVRRSEFAMRRALGAGRSRLVMQVVTEIALLTMLAGAIGLGLAWAGLRMLVVLAPTAMPRIATAGLDLRVIAFTALVVGVATLVAGLAPVAVTSSRNIDASITSGARNSEGRRTGFLRASLVILEIALAFAIVVSSGLLVRSFLAASSAPLGFEPAGVYRGTIGFARATSSADVVRFERRLIDRLSSTPGITKAAMARYMVFSAMGTEIADFGIAGRTYKPGTLPAASIAQVTPDYFAALGIPIVRGRSFTRADRVGTLPVAIVDDRIARLYFTDDAIGKHIFAGSPAHVVTIIGVTGHVLSHPYDNNPLGYVAYDQFPPGYADVIVKSPIADSHLRTHVEDAIAAIDPDTALVSFGSVQDSMAPYRAPTLVNAILLGILAIVALLLAVAGIYAVVSYSVQQRTHEFGVRKAIGATAAGIVRAVLRGALLYGAIGIGAGLVLAAGLAYELQSLLFNTSVFDAMTFVTVVVLLLACTVLAALVPAARAMRLEPAQALRYE
jgi:putative ABC transport system permease protein